MSNYRNNSPSSGGQGKGFGEKKPQPKKPAYPSLGQQARNFAKTAGQVARNPKPASAELYEKRMKICRECAFFDSEQVRCRKCGCKLKGKARFEAAKCPIQKW